MSSSDRNVKEWNPQWTLSAERHFVVMVLNQPLNEENKSFIKKIWNSALLRVAVDGGANVVAELNDDENPLYIPDIVCGDFDSATSDVLDFFEQQGSDIIETPDQNETDFTKALRVTQRHLSAKKLEASSIIVVARNGNRLDHVLGNLNTLYEVENIIDVPVFLLGYNSLTWLLKPGSHEIHVSEEFKESHVGLIPLGCEVNDVSTSGLKWNLNHDSMRFGGLISTCNRFINAQGTVQVSTDGPLIWTMEVNLSSFL